MYGFRRRLPDKGLGRGDPGPLLSQKIVTDPPEADWHRIALVWDGSQRTLYVDGAQIAEDNRPAVCGAARFFYPRMSPALFRFVHL